MDPSKQVADPSFAFCRCAAAQPGICSFGAVTGKLFAPMWPCQGDPASRAHAPWLSQGAAEAGCGPLNGSSKGTPRSKIADPRKMFTVRARARPG